MRLSRHAALAAAAFLLAASARAASLDLNDFFADPTVTVSPDGSMATLAEDDIFAVVILSNDPGFGEPNIILPELGSILRFEYEFLEPVPDNDDEFSAFILDVATGGSIGSMWEFVTRDPGAGTVTFDLASLAGQTLGLEFRLSALLPGDKALSSTVKISNVRLEGDGGGGSNGGDGGGVSTVPEPGTLLLVTGCLAALCFGRRKS